VSDTCSLANPARKVEFDYYTQGILPDRVEGALVPQVRAPVLGANLGIAAASIPLVTLLIPPRHPGPAM
jgi:hypothetical protein